MDPDGLRTADQEACQNPHGKSLGHCVLEPVHGNYFCGIAGAACSADVPCDGGAAGGLGEKMQAPGVCLGALGHGAGGICGAIAAECSGGTGSAVRNDLCVSGACNPDSVHCIDASMQEGTGCNNGVCNTGYYCVAITDTCSKVVTEVGGSCFYGGSAACGNSPTAGALYCEMTTHTCAAKLPAGAACEADDNCANGQYCTSNKRKCAAKQNKFGAECDLDPYAQCGTDPFLVKYGFSETGQLFPSVVTSPDGTRQLCSCGAKEALPENRPPLGTWSLIEGQSCRADPKWLCGFTHDGIKLVCSSDRQVCARPSAHFAADRDTL
ncbi:hypothetical protein JCM10908_000770 [Rhodotorula pacifica]|uniref:uncharacterized protein n=1 Tax=Rhodotorula pacifica TaxID=1495444 RepID=UPI00316C9D16